MVSASCVSLTKVKENTMIAVKEFAKNSQRKEAQKEALSDCLESAISRLRAEDIYNHQAHGFKESGDRLRGGCPFHQSKSGSSFVVTISSKLFWCAGCQVGGGPVDYRASLQAGRWVNPRGKDFVEVVRELAADANVSFPELEYSSEAVAKALKWERRRAVLAATQKYCQNFLWSDRPEALKARQYLVKERGLTEEEIKQLPIGYYSSADEIQKHLISKGFTKNDWMGTGCVWQGMEGYITFLWNDATGRPLTFYGRYYEKHPPEGKPKTIAAPGTKTKQSPLYLDRALKAGHKEVVLVEGVLDTVLLQAKGDNRVCAYVAASCSGDQIKTLKSRGIARATLCGDPDHGGETGTNSNLLRLTEAGISVYIAPKLPDGLDPDEFLIRDGMEGWKAHIDAAEHGFRWKAKRLIEAGNTSTDKGKADILKNAIAFCKAVKNHPELDIFFWSVIRNSLGMEPEEFRTQLEKLWESALPEVVEFCGSGGSGGDGGDGQGGDGERKILKFPGLDAPDMAAIACSIREILAQDLPPSSVQAAKIRIRTACPTISERELNQLWSAIEQELELEETRSDRAAEVDELVKLGDQSLKLNDFLPPELATPVSAWCGWLNIRPETALTALLGGTSSLHKAGTELVISRKRNFTVPPTIYAAIVSESGQKKSPIVKTLIRQPLDAIENSAEDEYKAAMEDYQEEMEAWRENGSKGESPKEPSQPPVWYFTDANGEGIKAHANQYPRKTLMGLVDELAGLFNSENKYRNGRGSDRQDMLSYFDSCGAKILRAAGVKARIPNIYMSLFGTIQPDVLKRLMKDCSDPDGQWARFLFVNQPLAASTLDDDESSLDIIGRITDFYRWLNKVPEMEYRLTYEAFMRYKPVYNQLERLRVSHSQAGMRAVYSKMEGYIGRLAINLHAFYEWAAGKSVPDAEIPLAIMERAITLAKFYIGQVKLVHFNSDDSELAPLLVKLIDLSKRLQSVGKEGWIKAKDFINSMTRTKRPKPDVARSWMREAEALGFGCTRGNGVHLEYHWDSDNKPPSPTDPPPKKVDAVDAWETKVDDLSTAETTIYQGVEKKVDKVDENPPSSPDGLVNTQYNEISSPNTVVETDVSKGPSTSSTFSGDDHSSSISAVDNLSPSCLPELEVSTFSGEVSDTQQVGQYPNDHSKNDTDVATEAVNLQEASNTQYPNDRVRFLTERYPHCNLGGFKALTRNDHRKTIEASIEMLSGECKERVRGFWQRIESRFAH
jgi:DNA primase catalytic core